MRINSLRQRGGVNSIDNFARSWNRALAFHEVGASRPSFLIQDEEDDDIGERQQDVEHGQRSLLRQQLARSESHEYAVDEPSEENLPDTNTEPDESLFSVSPHRTSPLLGSYRESYGTLTSRLNDSAKADANRLYKQQRAESIPHVGDDPEPLVLKKVEHEDGTKTMEVVGQSTMPQTIANSVNVLIGVGLLSLPLGIKHAGWLIGLVLLVFAAATTAYTAKLLAKCMDTDSSMLDFADIARCSFGKGAGYVVRAMFCLELVLACVALVILFADSLSALVAGTSVLTWQIACGVILIPLCFAPFRVLSLTSGLGILCCLGRMLSHPPLSPRFG